MEVFMSVKCFDVVSMVVEEATDRFSPLWKVDNDNYSILRQYCSAIDSISNEFDGESFEVSIDEINMTISITLECSDIVVDTTNCRFCELLKRAISTSFSTSKEGNLNLTFKFPSIWSLV
jgi:hypothetical protein